MSKASYLLIALFVLISCKKDEDSSILQEEICSVESTENKINGGSILQFRYLYNGTNDMTYMGKKTGAKWISISPLIRVKFDYNLELVRPYEFPIENHVETIRASIPVILNSNIDYILLKPLTDFSNNINDFWGDFYVETEEEWLEIEVTYFELYKEMAKISLDFPQVKMLSIGNELREFAKRRPEFFKSLIVYFRENYPNLKLTYAANWDEYEGITFWDELDYIGVNSYFPLVNKKTPEVEEIVEAFEPIKNNLKTFSCSYNKPILFTEYGYRSIDFAAWKAWELEPIGRNNVNHQAQNNGYEGFYQSFWDEDWVAGGFFWEWEVSFTELVSGHNNGWQVSGKPEVQEIIKKYYLPESFEN
ncbi:glycoside hydrolase family 113 [Aureivirga marina]|uniref:glycoside hydrolase family 113 n=1 Tax=Aureivirga marina TaxID=1182451 RepID=UPI0018CA3F40|nr:glycoside hydrolase family 2 TIM barrel-domain containing protein [Aureivirga marina]